MRNAYFALCLVLFFQVRDSLETCTVARGSDGEASYKCNTIEDLEQHGDHDLLDVTIHNGPSVPSLGNATHTRKPNLHVVLLEDATDGFGTDTYNALKRLHELFLHTAQVGTLRANVLENLPLQELWFQNNHILAIEEGAFSTLRSLQQLHVDKNQLSVVKAGIFSNLPLDTLSLSHNRIGFIERSAFANLPNLKKLYLDNNDLTEFQPELYLTQRGRLEVLWLNDNSLAEIDRNVVRGFDNLVELNLDNNRISKIVSYTFESLQKLERLYLSSNLLLELSAEAFPQDGLPRLQKLYISNNRLSYLTNPVLGKLTKLKYIRIGGNPWQCPCLDFIQRWLGDYGVTQVCDKDYYTGTRPICVVVDAHPTTCNYKSDQFHYYTYSETNNKAPPSPKCEL